MWWQFGVRGAPAFAEQFDGPPRGDGWTMWIGGVVIALLVAIPAIPAAVSSHYAMAVFFISYGLILHFHYFWGLHPKLCRLSWLAKNVTALGMIGPILYGIYYMLMHM